MSNQKAAFFCSRPDGTLTPLIPLDELEKGLSIRGLSRTITAGDTQGMTSCGVATRRKELWAVDGTTQSEKPVPGPGILEKLRGILVEILKVDAAPAKLREEVSTVLTKGLEKHFSTFEQAMALVRAQQAAKRPQKEYCSYWIRHGECDYQQQGCLYRHHLPTDDEALDFLGLRDVPRWFRDKYDVPSVLRFGNNSRIMFRAYVNAVYKKLAEKDAAAKKDTAAKKAREQAGQSGTTTTATADASNSLNVPASANGDGQLVTRGHHGRYSKSPRGGNGGGALHGRGRGGHHYRTVQPAQHIHHNGQGNQLAITAPPSAPTPPIVPSKEGGSTFAEVAAGTSKQASPGTSSNSGSENSSDTAATVGAPGCITLNIMPKENGLVAQSSTHKALHNSVMNGNDDAKLPNNETRNLDIFGLPNVTKSNEDFRKSSRRLFQSSSFGTDGADDGTDPMWEISDGCMDVFGLPSCAKHFVSTAIVVSSEALQADSSSAASILNSLVAESEPLENKMALANWGPIREAVKHPQPAITEPIITNGNGLAEVHLILNETEGAPRPGKHSAIDIANFCSRVANVHARDGNGDLAAEWNDLAHRAHAKAIFAWRLKVNNEFGDYVNFGPDIYTIWRQKRGTADYPYATGSRSLDIDQGFCVPVQAPENAALDVWLAQHRSLILDSAAQEFAS